MLLPGSVSFDPSGSPTTDDRRMIPRALARRALGNAVSGRNTNDAEGSLDPIRRLDTGAFERHLVSPAPAWQRRHQRQDAAIGRLFACRQRPVGQTRSDAPGTGRHREREPNQAKTRHHLENRCFGLPQPIVDRCRVEREVKIPFLGNTAELPHPRQVSAHVLRVSRTHGEGDPLVRSERFPNRAGRRQLSLGTVCAAPDVRHVDDDQVSGHRCRNVSASLPRLPTRPLREHGLRADPQTHGGAHATLTGFR